MLLKLKSELRRNVLGKTIDFSKNFLPSVWPLQNATCFMIWPYKSKPETEATYLLFSRRRIDKPF